MPKRGCNVWSSSNYVLHGMFFYYVLDLVKCLASWGILAVNTWIRIVIKCSKYREGMFLLDLFSMNSANKLHNHSGFFFENHSRNVLWCECAVCYSQDPCWSVPCKLMNLLFLYGTCMYMYLYLTHVHVSLFLHLFLSFLLSLSPFSPSFFLPPRPSICFFPSCFTKPWDVRLWREEDNRPRSVQTEALCRWCDLQHWGYVLLSNLILLSLHYQTHSSALSHAYMYMYVCARTHIHTHTYTHTHTHAHTHTLPCICENTCTYCK